MKAGTIIMIVLMLILFGWIAEVKVTFNPFSVKADKWMLGLGLLMLYVGLRLVVMDVDRIARESTLNAVIELMDEKIKEGRSNVGD